MHDVKCISDDGKYYFPVNISDADVDICDHWKYSAMLSAMQEAGAIHAELSGASRDRLMREFSLTYVVVRMHIEMDRLPGEHEKIEIATWNNGEAKLILPRYYEFYDESGAEIGRAVSQWMLFDINARKIVHPTREILTDRSVSNAEIIKIAAPLNVLLPKSPEILRSLAVTTKELTTKDANIAKTDTELQVEVDQTPIFTTKTRKPMYSDMDHNGHVNNARYAEWVMDALPEELLINQKRAVSMIDITYKREITAEAVISGEISDVTTESIVSGSDFAMIARANGVGEAFNAIEVFGKLR